MKKQYLAFSLIIFAFLAGCEKQAENDIVPSKNPEPIKQVAQDVCYEESYTLYAGQTIEVGTLYISNDEDELFVTYDLTGTDWYLAETHLYVGPYEDMPVNGGGNPKTGHFPYSQTHDYVQEYTYTLDLADFDDCFTVAAHAEVVQMDENGNQIGSETAWADGGTEFEGNRWGWYLDEFCPGDCDCNVAFGFSTYFTSTCFSDLGVNENGWSIGPFFGELPNGTCIKNDLIACPSGCGPESGTDIGTVAFSDHYQGFKVVFYELEPGYQIEAAYVYWGTTPLPVENGNYVFNPDDFPYQQLNPVDPTQVIFNFPSAQDDIYVVAYAVYSQQ